MTGEALSAMRDSLAALWALKPEGRDRVFVHSEQMREIVGDPTSDVAHIIDCLCLNFVAAREVGWAVNGFASSRAEVANVQAIERLKAAKEELAPMLAHLVQFGHAYADEVSDIETTIDAIVGRFEPIEASVDAGPIGDLQKECMRVMFAAGYGHWSHMFSTKKAASLVSAVAVANGLDFKVSSMTTLAAEARRSSKDDGSALQGLVLNSRFSNVPPIDPPMGQEREPKN